MEEMVQKNVGNDKLLSAEALAAENKALKEELYTQQKNYELLKQEHENFQAKFIGFQEGREIISAGLIRRYKEATEKAEKELAQMRSRLNNALAERDRITDESKRNLSDLHAQLADRNELQKAKLQADLGFAEAKRQQERLLTELHDKQDAYTALNAKYEAECLENQHLTDRLAAATGELKNAISIVQNTKERLAALLEGEFCVKNPEEEEKNLDATDSVEPKEPSVQEILSSSQEPEAQKADQAYKPAGGAQKMNPVLTVSKSQTPEPNPNASIFRRAARFFGGI